MEVIVIDTGTANLASVLAGLRRAGAQPVTSRDPKRVRDATRVVLPGVGAFGAGMECLREAGLVDVVAERVRAERPLLAVCLGLQLLCSASEESPGVQGIGVIDGAVTRFTDSDEEPPAPRLRIPQLGWNRVEPDARCELLREGYAYYANTYRLEQIPSGYQGARSSHGGSFVAALERGPVLACQFHPELSGRWGHELLSRWLERGASC